MDLGPTLIKSCSECSGWIEEDTILSGNTFDTIFWTDGKMDAPMLPDLPRFVKCPHCLALIWIDEQKKVAEIGPFSENHAYDEAKSYYHPKLHDYFLGLKGNNLNREKELYLRLHAWWEGNDKRRYSNKKHCLSDEEKENLQSFFEMLNTSDDNDRIMKAEIKRELGQFEDAEIILKAPFGDQFSQAASILRALVQQQDHFVAEMKFDE